ncbi:Carnitinyl-CoA dehydratase [Escovopsis weberi]|uniref:Carnitinyl-CoA dehydratase n=1 Tax=Escovopsis weberi TaxID=150374 RepID=A0A0M9VUW7_ESCWE|nr:Carnitinyl-CoA dehydratase [Escovopsis weberi]
MSKANFTTPPPAVTDVLITFPFPGILLVTLNRPKQLNSIPQDLHSRLHALWSWYDAEPSLRCAVLTGAGRAFCAGADLRDWNQRHSATPSGSGSSGASGAAAPPTAHAVGGFCGLSNRRGRKPIVAAVNGVCMGGGMEAVLNTDLVVAAADAKFALPEVRIGVVPIQGALPRLVRSVGMQRASEMALLGRTYTADQLLRWGVVNRVVPREEVLETALRWALELAAHSPDSVIVTKEGLLGGWDAESPTASTDRLLHGLYKRVDGGDNMREGILSFVEKRKPVWKDSKL